MSLNRKIWCELKIVTEKLKESRGEEEISQVILETVNKFCNKKFLDLPNDFSNAFKKFQRYEGILYTLPYYRDHFIHMFNVFYLGYLIINGWWNNKLPFVDSTDEISKSNIIKRWFISSIQHDLAYPVEMAQHWVPLFTKNVLNLDVEIWSNFDWSPILLAKETTYHIEKLTENFTLPLEGNCSPEGIYQSQISFKEWFYQQLFKNHDHGVLSSLNLLNYAWQKAEIDYVFLAALDVALHNYWNNRNNTIGQLSFELYPITFLLTYCDTVQEWGRANEVSKKGLHRLIDPLIKFKKLDITQNYTAVLLMYNIEERCKNARKDWYSLDDTKRRRIIEECEAKIINTIDCHVRPLHLAWKQGSTGYSFRIKAINEKEKEFCDIPII